VYSVLLRLYPAGFREEYSERHRTRNVLVVAQVAWGWC
jgi:hypothetical protein